MTFAALVLAAALQTASGAPAATAVEATIPTVSADVDGVQRPLDTFAVIEDGGVVKVLATSPSRTIAFRPTPPPGVPTTGPVVSFDQKLTLQDPRTGKLTVYDQYVIHRTIRSEPVADGATTPEGVSTPDPMDDRPIDKRADGTPSAADPSRDRPTDRN